MVRRLIVAFALLMTSVVAAPSVAEAQTGPRQAFTITPCLEMSDSIVRLYSAYFLRDPDETGFNSWYELYQTTDWSLGRISNFFATSDEFIARYGQLTNAEFVDRVYINVLGRVAEPEGRSFWIGELDSGRRDRGAVMLGLSESQEYVTRTNTFAPLAGYFNSYAVGTSFSCGFGSARIPLQAGVRYVDVAIVNDTTSSSTYSIQTVQSGVLVDGVTNEEILANNIEWFFNRELSVSSALQLTMSDNLAWMVVDSPFPTPETRSGWEGLPGLQSLGTRSN